jgi:hypothetical protein
MLSSNSPKSVGQGVTMKSMKLISLVIFLVAATAQAQSISNMLGPNSPAKADTNGNGLIEPGDADVTPTSTGGPSPIVVHSPWTPGTNANNTIIPSNPNGSGKYQTFTRSPVGRTQTLSVSSFTGGTPSAFSGSEVGPATQNVTGSLIDPNNDGIFDGISGNVGVAAKLSPNATPGSFTINFVYQDTNADGFADYLSVPWAQAGLLGVNANNTINGVNPQVWVPMADTNGDGMGDAIVPDFDGNNLPDGNLFASDPGAFGPVAVAAANVPTLSEWTMMFLLLTLTCTALWYLRKNREDMAGV